MVPDGDSFKITALDWANEWALGAAEHAAHAGKMREKRASSCSVTVPRPL